MIGEALTTQSEAIGHLLGKFTERLGKKANLGLRSGSQEFRVRHVRELGGLAGRELAALAERKGGGQSDSPCGVGVIDAKLGSNTVGNSNRQSVH